MRKEIQKKAAQVDRRGFLRGAGLAIGTAGAAAAVSGSGVLAQDGDDRNKDTRYQESDHVKAYYKAARF